MPTANEEANAHRQRRANAHHRGYNDDTETGHRRVVVTANAPGTVTKYHNADGIVCCRADVVLSTFVYKQTSGAAVAGARLLSLAVPNVNFSNEGSEDKI